MNIPRVIIAGPSSGVGKTTVSVGLMGALREKGLEVQAFKVGPDYIDPSYHTAITGRPSRNLDTWMTPPRVVEEIFVRACRDAGIALVEGVMGMYDGINGTSTEGSTAHIARILQIPVILVVDVYAAARSAGAVVLGFRDFDKEIRLSGVILNRVAGRKHADWCRESIETATNIPVLGALPIEEEVRLPERHLGLVPTAEQYYSKFFKKVVEHVERNIDLKRLVKIAAEAPPLPERSPSVYPLRPEETKVSMAVGFDEAFNFYYQDNLDLIGANGCKLVFFSPLHDASLPENVDGVYLGGGFPETTSAKLEVNSSMRKSLRKSIEDGMPVYAECGGLMYLTNSITDLQGKTRQMVGVLDASTTMTKSLSLSYTEAEALTHNFLSRTGQILRGHEFHYSKIINIPRDARFAYRMKIGMGINGKSDGLMQHSALASYMHLHFASNAKLASRLVATLKKYNRS